MTLDAYAPAAVAIVLRVDAILSRDKTYLYPIPCLVYVQIKSIDKHANIMKLQPSFADRLKKYIKKRAKNASRHLHGPKRN